MRWLRAALVGLLPGSFPGLWTEESPTSARQTGQNMQGDLLNKNSLENQTDWMWATPGPNGTRPTSRGWGSVPTPVPTTAEGSTQHKTNPPVISTSHNKYWIPPVVVVVLLIVLLLMYKRKKGKGSLSRTVSINEYSSDSDLEDDAVRTAEQTNPSLQGFQPIPEETVQTASAMEETETVLGTQDQSPSQAGL